MSPTLLSLVLACASAGAASEIVDVPAGSFVMGGGRAPDEPSHRVELSAFRIDRREVSVAEFEAFARQGYTTPALWSAQGRAWLATHPQGAGTPVRAAGRGADHPVVAVTWYEADAYCRWRGGALPTEAQWERAACGEGGRRFPWGDAPSAPGVAWFDEGKYGVLHAVQTTTDDGPASPYGVLQMAGNVWEWTADWYHRDAYAHHAERDATGPATGTWRSLRGGSFMNLPSYCSCTHREPARPDRVALTTGLRCVYGIP